MFLPFFAVTTNVYFLIDVDFFVAALDRDRDGRSLF